MRRVNILITEDYTTKKVAATKFTASNNVVISDDPLRNDVTLQNYCDILDSAIVKCSPEDTYDFETGALIALMKMCGVDKVVRACNEAFSEDTFKTYALKYERELNELKKEKEQIIVAKNVLYNRLEKENEKLQHEYDLCMISENALKITTQMQNKSIEKLTKAIDGYKEDLYKVTKRCEELEIKENTLNKQEETINKREEEMSVYFGGRGSGKQYKALIELFKKIPKDKVQAAYVVAYKESLIWCTSQPSIRESLDKHTEQINNLTVDSLIEKNRAFTQKCIDEWLYRPPTKREEMWENILKEGRTPVYVKREDVHDFLKECQVMGIKWATGKMPLETMPFHMSKGYDGIYFFVMTSLDITKSTSGTKEFRHVMCWWMTASDEEARNSIKYLPPMRWDLFKKGRIVVGVKNKNELEEFRKEVEINTGIKDIPICPTNLCLFYSFDKYEYKIILETIEEPNIAKINGHKVYYWEDVRDKTTTIEDPYDTWKW